VSVFVQDPESFLEELGVELDCAIVEGAQAILDVEHRAWVNHEVFFFSTGSQKEKFLQHPERFCGIVTDPVTREKFEPNKVSPRLDHDGRPYFFLSEGSLSRFEAAPDSFAIPKGRMVKMTSG
jgi:YHS domain-containing protein